MQSLSRNDSIDGPDIRTSTPALYDRYMGPLLFEPYAKLVAERCAPVYTWEYGKLGEWVETAYKKANPRS